ASEDTDYDVDPAPRPPIARPDRRIPREGGTTLDPMEPIAGISLEAYAELCALMKDTGTDVDRQLAIAVEHGHARDAWEAAQQGWTERMSNPATAGTVATAFMPLYQSAL